MRITITRYVQMLQLPTRQQMAELASQAAKRHGYVGRAVDYASFVGRFADKWVRTWNQSVEQLFGDAADATNNPAGRRVLAAVEQLWSFEANVEQPKLMLGQLIARLDEERPLLRADDVVAACSAALEADDKLLMGADVSVLEVCLLIAIMHHTEIYDREPFNFEMVLTRYRKWENASTQSRMETVERGIALKSFEHLHVSTCLICSTFRTFPLSTVIHCIVRCLLRADARAVCADQHDGRQGAA